MKELLFGIQNENETHKPHQKMCMLQAQFLIKVYGSKSTQMIGHKTRYMYMYNVH